MLLHFDCHACGTQHPSRLRIGKPHLLRMVMHAFREVLEPCPLTGRWITVRVEDLHWTADASSGPHAEPVDLWRPLRAAVPQADANVTRLPLPS